MMREKCDDERVDRELGALESVRLSEYFRTFDAILERNGVNDGSVAELWRSALFAFAERTLDVLVGHDAAGLRERYFRCGAYLVESDAAERHPRFPHAHFCSARRSVERFADAARYLLCVNDVAMPHALGGGRAGREDLHGRIGVLARRGDNDFHVV